MQRASKKRQITYSVQKNKIKHKKLRLDQNLQYLEGKRFRWIIPRKKNAHAPPEN